MIKITCKQRMTCLNNNPEFKALDNIQKAALKKLPYLNEIEGWLSFSEAAELYTLASALKSKKSIICEIGCWKGKSTYVLGTALKTMGRGLIYSIDPFDGSGDTASLETYKKAISKMNTSLLKNFQDTIHKYNLGPYITIIPTTSKKAKKYFDEKKIDLLFIDGNHEYESVQADYRLWSPLIKKNGFIALHDVGAKHVDGPRMVMEKFITKKNGWKNIRMVGEMGVAQKI